MSVRKSPKIQKLVVNAIRKLQDVEGSTPREISNYISQEYDVPSTKIQRQVKLALARAVSYGILQRSKGGYYACNREIGICQPGQPQLEEGQLTEKCGGRRGRGHRVKRARSRKSRRRKSGAMGCKRRGKKRGRGRSSRKRSRCGKSTRRRRPRGGCGTSGRRKRKSRSRRGGRRGCSSMKSRRRRTSRCNKSRRRGRSGKKCPPTADGGAPGNEDFEVFSGRGSRGRARSASATRHENNENRSLSSDSFEEEDRMNEKHDETTLPIDSPDVLLD